MADAGRRRRRELRSSTIWRDKFYVRTNDGAPRYRVFASIRSSPRAPPGRRSSPQSDATLESAIDRRRAPRARRTCATRRASSRSTTSTASSSREVELPRLGTVGRHRRAIPTRTPRYFSFTSFTEPQIIYKTSIKTGKVDEWARIKLPIDTSKLRRPSRLLPVEGRHQDLDVHHPRKDAKQDGTNPTILYGYGGFNVQHDAGLRRLARGVARARRRLRDPEPARRRRVRRGLAQGRDARREAERVRRLHRRGRVPRSKQGWTSQAITSRSTAARTAACSSAPRSRSGPSCSAP